MRRMVEHSRVFKLIKIYTNNNSKLSRVSGGGGVRETRERR